jgi:hypothetical protein
MASGTNAFTSRAGFNQSGGSHFIVLTALEPDVTNQTNTYINTITTAGSNSGGATTAPVLNKVSMSSILGFATNGASSLVGAGRLLKDEGRTIVSSGRTFRKFSPVVQGLSVSSFGKVGAAATGPNTGFGSFYLEVGREGSATASVTTGAPAPIARYF